MSAAESTKCLQPHACSGVSRGGGHIDSCAAPSGSSKLRRPSHVRSMDQPIPVDGRVVGAVTGDEPAGVSRRFGT